jgi:DNA helicase-2/ATP-dependent DNA helicase PcrA
VPPTGQPGSRETCGRNVVEALRANDPGVVRVVTSLSHLMVDEYQDVNPAQEALIRELHARSDTLFVVGDDDQSIYAWRGADVSNILTFQTRYPAATVHTLSQNFRSTSSIVTAADAFVAGELGATRIREGLPRREVLPRREDWTNLRGHVEPAAADDCETGHRS